jgi:hypothetical protein
MPAYSPLYPGISASDSVMQIGMHLQMHLHIQICKKECGRRDLNPSFKLGKLK